MGASSLLFSKGPHHHQMEANSGYAFAYNLHVGEYSFFFFQTQFGRGNELRPLDSLDLLDELTLCSWGERLFPRFSGPTRGTDSLDAALAESARGTRLVQLREGAQAPGSVRGTN